MRSDVMLYSYGIITTFIVIIGHFHKCRGTFHEHRGAFHERKGAFHKHDEEK